MVVGIVVVILVVRLQIDSVFLSGSIITLIDLLLLLVVGIIIIIVIATAAIIVERSFNT